ncbi:MAG: type II toxin-antitoxin system prevent-host-death family antitoxin [Propionibacteriaceae bacterium]|jgi:prevent-host-death family protein|nr:type II toxin-antitoxin system prevent-host-death family antitoxin [Propionibacteriaceae bacterium]
MEFFTARDLKTRPGAIWEAMAAGGEAVLTNNGRPAAVMVGLDDTIGLDETLRSFRRARALTNLEALRRQAAARGPVTQDEIDAEIAAARADRAGR